MIEVSASCVLPAAQPRVWEGAVYRERNPVLGPWKTRTSWRVEEFVPPRRQVHVSGDFPLSERVDVILELAHEREGTRFTLTLRGRPALGVAGALAGRLMRPRIGRDNRRTIASFAELVRRDG